MRSGLRKSIFLICVCIFTNPAIFAESKKEPTPAGHSQHGEVFNEGPRQKAYLMNGTGDIEFKVTTKNPLVQKFVEQGIGQLHGFWYFEAERSFRQAAMLDPDCAIAYWGMAKANSGNSKRAKGFIAEAMKRKSKASPREAMYIDALNAYLNGKGSRRDKAKKYVLAIDALSKKYPDDLEALALYGYVLYKYRSYAKKKYEEVNAVLNKVLKKKPLHPVHHFRIHLWDYKNPKAALNSAARCGQGSPSIAHMWHMPGHIYSRLKRYEDAVWQMEASARTDHAHMMRDRVMPDQIHNFAHNNEWLIRNMIYIGRVDDAVALAKNMIELPRHPKYNTATRRGSSRYGRMRLFQVLLTYELWDDLIALSNGPHLEPTTSKTEQFKRLQYLGLAYAITGKKKEANEVIAQLEKEAAKPKEPKTAPVKDRKPTKDKKPTKGKKTGSTSRGPSSSSKAKKAISVIRGYLALHEKKYGLALELLRTGGEDRYRQALAQVLAGKKDEALKSIQSMVSSKTNQVHPHAVLAYVQWSAGKKKEAIATFDKMRKMSGSIQLGSPVFARLAPIAKAMKLPEDWRIERKMPKDVGKRPDLDALGPLRWQPMPAPEWTLLDSQDKPRSLKDYRGKPVLVIFYLGYGCLHCAEQLQAFIPKAEKFRDQGIEMIAISSDNQTGLKRSQDQYKLGKIPFPLVSDEKLEIFKKYRAYDDFEKTPLHGTFLIDGSGRVRWQDISYEPFMNPDFVLTEAKRLLDQSILESVSTKSQK